MNIKILDCTLRDGGYVNNWNFGFNVISHLNECLARSGVDFVEIGFLQKCTYDNNKTLFNDILDFNNILQNKSSDTKYLGMITYGGYSIDEIPCFDNQFLIDGFRIIFKKSQINDALEYCKAVQNKGYKIFINPMHTYEYSDKELIELVEKINDISPYGVSIVDTMGIMKPRQVVRIFDIFDHNLNDDIAIGFHSHNNLQLSFSNATALLEYAYSSKREIIVDSSIRGMGRGAGNLCTELLMQHLNENYDKNYNLLPILKAIDNSIEKIYKKTPWGYNVPYYLAAINKCHPNYASFLSEKDSISIDAINSILLSIPNDKKSGYDKNLIDQLYLEYQSHKINDDKTIEFLTNELRDKQILILGSGKSILSEQDKISDFVKNNNVYIISLNFFTDLYNCNLAFVSNINRYKSAVISNKNYMITSNILNEIKEYEYILNYGSYINNSKMPDNSLLMLIKVLIKCGIKSINIAGCDGFDGDDYFDATLKNTSKIRDIDDRNEIVSIVLKELSNSIDIRFITQTKYMVE